MARHHPCVFSHGHAAELDTLRRLLVSSNDQYQYDAVVFALNMIPDGGVDVIRGENLSDIIYST